jgi:hypothetical protein
VNALREDWRETLIKNPSRIDLPEISKRAGISPGYHHSSYEFCSSFVHGSLYAMLLTESVNLQTGEGKVFFEQLTDILCGYVALAGSPGARPTARSARTGLVDDCEVGKYSWFRRLPTSGA